MRDSNISKVLRITAGIMGSMMLVIVLFSSFYIAAEADHDCIGEDCLICACIQQCEDTLRGMANGTSSRPAFVAPVMLLFLAAAFVISSVSSNTLVSQKVRLDN